MRSRVIPGSLVTIERREAVSLLKIVDLPTLGRPTITTEGSFSVIIFCRWGHHEPKTGGSECSSVSYRASKQKTPVCEPNLSRQCNATIQVAIFRSAQIPVLNAERVPHEAGPGTEPFPSVSKLVVHIFAARGGGYGLEPSGHAAFDERDGQGCGGHAAPHVGDFDRARA